MRTTNFVSLAGVLALVAGSAIAQPMEVVTVEAARSTTVGQSAYGVPIRQITIQSRVSYADLDLTSEYGALQLENRIKETAKATCEHCGQPFVTRRSHTRWCGGACRTAAWRRRAGAA